MGYKLGQVQRDRQAPPTRGVAHAGELVPPPPPVGSRDNVIGIVVALGVLILSIVGLRAANRDAAHWGGAGPRGGG